MVGCFLMVSFLQSGLVSLLLRLLSRDFSGFPVTCLALVSFRVFWISNHWSLDLSTIWVLSGYGFGCVCVVVYGFSMVTLGLGIRRG